MAGYDVFATFYDDIMGRSTEKTQLLHSLIKAHHPKAQSILELACGTGTILAGLSPNYPDLTGLDQSNEMLQVARSKLPSAKFILGDMAHFATNRQFDVILCIFDSINHLIDIDAWEVVYKQAHAHLHPGGLFIFDMTTLGHLEMLSYRETWAQQFGDEHFIHMTVRPSGRVYVFDWDVKILEHITDDQYRRHDMAISEASFPIKLVQARFKALFKNKQTFEVAGDKVNDKGERIFFVLEKR